MLPLLTLGAVVGGMSNIVVGQSIPLGANTIGVAVGAGVMAVIQILAKKMPEKLWLKEWAMTISMFVGMIVAYAASLI